MSEDLLGATFRRPKAKPVRLIALSFGLGIGALALGIAIFTMPVEWKEAKIRFNLWRTGARSVHWEKHRGFTKDRCQGKPPAVCECVWFLHGAGDSAVSWRNFFQDPSAFANQSVRIFAMDLPGHGGSLRRRDLTEYRVSNMARELNSEIAKTSECARNAVVGNSFGGWVAAEMALQAPSQYAHLILIGSGGLAAGMEKDTFRELDVEGLKAFQRRAYFRPRELTDAEWKAAVERLKRSGTAEVMAAQDKGELLDGSLGKIKAKTTLIWGSADQVTPRILQDDFARGILNAKRVTLEECGHLPQKECPAKLFPAIQRALAE